jgi:hypothetical protein
MLRVRLRAVVVVWALLAATPSAMAHDIRVKPLVADGRISASFNAPAAFGDDAQAVVRSGLLLTFTYVIELRRPATVWFDRTLALVTASATVKLDTLTAVYQVSKLVDGSVVWSDRTADEAQVRAWMTSFDAIALQPGEPLQPNAEYYVRVRLQTSPRRFFSAWPWGRDDGLGRGAFTFIR